MTIAPVPFVERLEKRRETFKSAAEIMVVFPNGYPLTLSWMLQTGFQNPSMLMPFLYNNKVIT
eukprot:m.118286 g.118286  ORF g.118286 m.118286 type:complete len:63 (-) comp9338_c0_seq17:2361-2549(-)